MQTLHGGCHCGNIRVELRLTRAPGTYPPRACDCSFCLKHGAAYISDPLGSLRLTLRDEREATRYAQGSGQAQLLLCSTCGVLVSPLFEDGGRLYAAVNVNALENAAAFGAPQPVSPQTLSAGDKAKRWKELWFSDVAIGAQRPSG
ncbi:MAG TPA: hypothetical protein VNX02_09340 [Steroidobacteraceae bacterium]|jgi:hypothetical protein|nr:hypothetical protein [Steroidobacteraceae bacterium]